MIEATSATNANVSNPERWLSVVAGTAVAAYGLTRRSVSGLVLAALGGGLVLRGATGQCPVYNSLGISTATDGEGDQVSVPYGRGIRVEKSVTINAPPEQLYTFWRNFENLPRFMDHVKSVTVVDDKRSLWVAKGPAGSDAEWDAEIINEIPNELIGWRSVDGSQVDNAGSVHFTRAIGGRGTVVKVVLRYDPPAGVVGATIAKLFGQDPAHQVMEDLRTFKQLMEAGEIPRVMV
ncbi:MAG TPA: SRPBCC family protein [Thermoanaerobaculia bacterium]|nr:SRPBCC family protein [Thermoanaerobaculia bacterium]